MLRGLRLEGSLEVSPLLDGNVSILPLGSCTSKPLGLIGVCWLDEIVEGSGCLLCLWRVLGIFR